MAQIRQQLQETTIAVRLSKLGGKQSERSLGDEAEAPVPSTSRGKKCIFSKDVLSISLLTMEF